ncbi:phosphotriesterase [Nocardioides maradonensis]
MTTVETVRGPVPVEDLGQVLAHEHVFTIGTEIRQNYPDFPDPWDEDRRVADAVAKLKDVTTRGVRTIVDPTVIGLGRYIPRIQRINEQVDINIVVGTGIYTYHDEPVQFHFQGPGLPFDRPEPMVDLFVNDIREGIAGTGVKAGVLKCAIDEAGMVHGVERVMHAVAQAHVETGVPVIIHTHAHGEMGIPALEVMKSEGADLSKVCIGHSGDSTDIAYLRTLADQGVMLGMDRFGVDVFCTTPDRTKTVVEMIRLGYVESMLMSHDASCYSDFYPESGPAELLPNWHYTHIHDDVLPAMREAGVTEDQITTLMVENPARWLSVKAR